MFGEKSHKCHRKIIAGAEVPCNIFHKTSATCRADGAAEHGICRGLLE